MNQNTGRLSLYLLVLGTLFGLLYLMRFVIPHYEPEEHSDDHSYPEEYVGEEIAGTENVAESDEPGETNVVAEKDPQTVEKKTQQSQQNTSSGNDNYFTELRKSYRENILSKLPAGKPRSDIIIRYYKHPPDGNKVYVLRDFGFYIHERPVEQVMAEYESNAIYYGDNVSREDLLIVASALINQGMPIKNIQPSLYHDGWKSNSIEIGADSTMISKEPLTLEELKNLRFDFL